MHAPVPDNALVLLSTACRYKYSSDSSVLSEQAEARRPFTDEICDKRMQLCSVACKAEHIAIAHVNTQLDRLTTNLSP